MKKTYSNGFDDADSFWNLDALTPPRPAPKRHNTDVETVPVSLGESKAPKRPTVYGYSAENSDTSPSRSADIDRSHPKIAESSTKYPPIKSSPNSTGQRIDFDEWLRRKRDSHYRFDEASDGDEIYEYTPTNPLIAHVKVTRRSTFDKIPDKGLSDMLAMWDKSAVFDKNVEFTALFPQYSRMTAEQKNCYLGFRSEVMQGRFPEVDESYILFLLYEIINLPEKLPPDRGVNLICSLLTGYPSCSDSLFASMCDWLTDYCLIHKLNAPTRQLASIREKVYKRATWKEFYVPFKTNTSAPDACVLISTSSAYNYRSSRYYTQDTEAIFEEHIPAAVGAAILAISAIDPAHTANNVDTTTLTHEAYRGAYRSAQNRYTVSIECYCFTRSPLLRQTVTALVKYSENFVREMLGITSRLTVSCLGTDKKQLVKEYFEPYIKHAPKAPPAKRGRKRRIDEPTEYVEQIPEYERLYEPPTSEFSVERAQEIERRSWKTTDMLISAFSDVDTSHNTVIAPLDHIARANIIDTKNINTTDKIPANSDTSPAIVKKIDVELCGLKLLLNNATEEFKAYALSHKLMPETLAERINEFAIEEYGDIAIEIQNGLEIIEDYREELKQAVSAKTDAEAEGNGTM